ncbi:MAG: hypothetical protein K6F20_03515 [Bacteroidaceae bacterium]|nr:hypothetical protein [Bacteroidaceae bacterium]
MKKYIFSFLTLLAIALSGLSLTSCNEDDLVTNQYQKGVALNVFGPSPVVRGGTLRFLGSNLDMVTQVIIPGVDPITDIEVVKAGIPSEIRVVVPKDGPEVGKIKLVDKNGKAMETKTELTYTETIEFEKFAPEEVMAGQEITITGDYLNLIHMVEFADGVQVGETAFTQHDRYTIKVLVPEEAQTGKIKLYDVDLTAQDPDAEDVSYNIIQSEKALIVGTPSVTKIKGRAEAGAQGDITAKQGESITISGSYMNLVSGVKIGGVEASEVEVAKDGKSVTATLPAEAPDGEIALVCKSGVEVPAGTLTTVAPSELRVEAAAVKAGTTLTVTGKDLDVVTSVSFPNAGQVSEIEVSATSLSVNVPTKAQEGELTLSMANGKTVATTFALVKPTATSYNNNPASAGSVLVITGTNLDLITGVAFGASVQKDIEASEDGTTLTLQIPLDGESGKPALSLDNGTSIEAPELTIEKPAFCYVPDESELAPEELKAGDMLVLNVENIEHLTGVLVNGVAVQYIQNGTKLFVGIPSNATKKSVLKLVSDNGEVEYEITVIPNSETTTVLWTGTALADDWANQPYVLSDAGVELAAAGAVEGDVITFHIVPTDAAWKLQIVEGHWGPTYASICSVGNDTEGGKFEEYDLEGNNGNYQLTLTKEMLDAAYTQQWWGGVFVLNGDNVIVDKITITHYESLEVTLWEGEAVADDWANQPYLLSDAGAELAAAEAKAGQTVRFYATPLADDWKVQIVEGHWGPTYLSVCSFGNDTESGKFTEYDLAAHGGCIELVLTQEMLDAAYTQQWWGGVFVANGDNIKITKITIE